MTRGLGYDHWAVFGLGASGIAAANALHKLGKQVIASDSRPYNQLQAEVSRLHPKVKVLTGGNHVGQAQVVVLSPGSCPRAARNRAP